VISLTSPADSQRPSVLGATNAVAFGSNFVMMTLHPMANVTAQQLERQLRRMTPMSAPPDQRAAVAQLSRVLGVPKSARRRRRPIWQLVGPHGETIALPDTIFYALGRVAEVLARGDAVTIVPVGKELTTQQAADLLNVSRQYLVRLLDEGRLPFTKTGKHRRLRIEDVLAFRDKRDAERRAALRGLTELTEELGGYERELS
jgi:excisionase family DNA binding protein